MRDRVVVSSRQEPDCKMCQGMHAGRDRCHKESRAERKAKVGSVKKRRT